MTRMIPLGMVAGLVLMAGCVGLEPTAPVSFDTIVLLDDDGDGVPDHLDNCPGAANADQADLDGDGAGDACDPDSDNDGTANALDNCPTLPNPGQADSDGEGAGDACEVDDDNDGVDDAVDLCPTAPGSVAGCPTEVVLSSLIEQLNAPLFGSASPGLQATLLAAQEAMAGGRESVARAQVSAFIRQLEAMVRGGRIAPATADPLIALAQALLGELAA